MSNRQADGRAAILEYSSAIRLTSTDRHFKDVRLLTVGAGLRKGWKSHGVPATCELTALRSEDPMNIADFITGLSCKIDDALPEGAHHNQAALSPHAYPLCSTCHCERSAAIPSPEGSLLHHRDCRVASLLAMTNWVRVRSSPSANWSPSDARGRVHLSIAQFTL